MRLLARDMDDVWFETMTGEGMLTDEQGRYTGEWGYTYERAHLPMSVSSCRNRVTDELFGRELSYDRALLVDLTSKGEDVGIDEGTLFWLDADPETAEPDYRTVRVARTPNLMHVLVEHR